MHKFYCKTSTFSQLQLKQMMKERREKRTIRKAEVEKESIDEWL